MSRNPVIADEARSIYNANPSGTKEEWASALFERLTSVGDPMFDYWLESVQLAACAKAVTTVARQEQHSRFAIAHDGRTMSRAAVLSVTTRNEDGGRDRQLKLYRYCTPAEFVEAARAEQANIDGRAAANKKRLEVVGLLTLRGDLMDEPTVADALVKAGLDPDEFFLDDEVAA